ncbi:ferrochelatase [Campylobacter helveticus]|uniref:ferrochelatase n=1 Tax=Campylobacter helveticus TaxID=28898 RepID=UPI00104A226D|nr:ferrochelatase [Campylobacter helveticus]MCR2062611.1 ferrochelatase [Campylobacter helveticus]MCR2065047.1 ferrochelatase [Campylobacter helveticus]MCR2066814.1 ferrochelatase [Campylobacter helveticus]QBL11809.1 ferrochelatase [Campylobacter helveticus]TNH32699.1 ferrochelatase [Campylobacter helveticus]
MKLVLFLNMGGATNLKDCELFLKNMFNDPYILGIKNDFLRSFVAFCITKARVGAMRENYKQIGSSSPLNFITASLCEKLNSRQESFKFDFINLYVPPFAKEILEKYTLKSEDELILFPLYPHHSQTTTTTSLEALHNEIKKQKIEAKIKEVNFFYKDENYNAMIIKHILKANEIFLPERKKSLIFSAHSLPISVIKKGDLYEKHIREHFELLKKQLSDKFDTILLSYQSKLGPVKWLGPSTEEILKGLKNEALIYPLSFCIDCSETIFELELEYRKIATKNYHLIACPNDSLEFQNFILSHLDN